MNLHPDLKNSGPVVNKDVVLLYTSSIAATAKDEITTEERTNCATGAGIRAMFAASIIRLVYAARDTTRYFYGTEDNTFGPTTECVTNSRST